MPVISEQMDIMLRICIPYIVMFILFILNMVFFYTPLSTTIEIPFVIMVIYYWSIYRPTLVPPLLVFIAGFCLDSLSGFPLGLSSFVFLIIRKIVFDQRLFLTGQPFMVIWFGFVIVSTVSALVQWGIFGFIHLQWTPIQPVIFMIISGTFLFPVIGVFLNLSHKILPLIPDQYSAVK